MDVGSQFLEDIKVMSYTYVPLLFLFYQSIFLSSDKSTFPRLIKKITSLVRFIIITQKNCCMTGFCKRKCKMNKISWPFEALWKMTRLFTSKFALLKQEHCWGGSLQHPHNIQHSERLWLQARWLLSPARDHKQRGYFGGLEQPQNGKEQAREREIALYAMKRPGQP